MSHSFAGRVVLITGAGSGIGRQTAFTFAELGAKLVLVDIDREGVERTALLCEKLGAAVFAHVADVASAEQMHALADQTHRMCPAVDVLINNAGVGVAGSFVGTDLATWSWAIDINIKGVVHGCHYFLPAMIARGHGGHVVNVASAAGLVAPKQMPVYATTKFAVVGLSESLRQELKPHGIGVTTLCPGVINTPITRNVKLSGHLTHDTGFKDRAHKLYKLRNYGPERVAQAIVSAVVHKRDVVPVAPEAWGMYYGKRLAPRVMEWLLSHDPI